MNIIETIDSETYTSISQYHADMDSIPYQRNAEYRAAIERKIERSWPKLNGTKGTQSAPGRKSVTVQTFGNGEFAVGSAAEVAALRNKTRSENEAKLVRGDEGQLRNLRIRVNGE